MNMKIYYAHPYVTYGSVKESEDLELIQKEFPKAEIINPRFIKPEDLNDSMATYLRIVKNCNLVIFRGIPNQSLTGGVGMEINHALDNQIKVVEIKNEKLIQMENKVEYLTREDSNRLFDKIRSMKEYKEYCGDTFPVPSRFIRDSK